MVKNTVLVTFFLALTLALVYLFMEGVVIHPGNPYVQAEDIPTIIPLLDSKLFMAAISVFSLYLLIYLIKSLWTIHHLAVKKATAMQSANVNLVIALSLCGIFIDKTWWVFAIILAFGRWDILAQTISRAISSGVNDERNKKD